MHGQYLLVEPRVVQHGTTANTDCVRRRVSRNPGVPESLTTIVFFIASIRPYRSARASSTLPHRSIGFSLARLARCRWVFD